MSKAPERKPPEALPDLAPPGDGAPPRAIKVEANLLRLPLFALHTKGLGTLDGIECRGRLVRDGTAHEFSFRATRNTATPYPGPLARSAHLAFLSLMTEQGFPLQNPIRWTWRDLCRRMGISCSGRTVERLKGAIRSTKGLMIASQYALYSKESGKLIRTERGLGLYDEAAFVAETLPDGRVAEANCLWLSEWYLANLNAFFTAPLDYDLWRSLDGRSAIASRLYEFLLINFYSGTPVLRIGYEKLAQFLPVRPERYLSDARRQFDPALKILAESGVIAAADWADSRRGLALLVFRRGRALTQERDRGQITFDFMEEEFSEAVEVEELRNLKPPEWGIVAEFYRLWAGQEHHRPTPKELAQARELIGQHGASKAKALVQLVVGRMRKSWPEAKAFGGVLKYTGEAAADYDKDRRRAEQERQEQARRRQEREEQERQRTERERFEAAWGPAWDELPEVRREEIRRAVVDGRPFLNRMPGVLRGLCLEELARRQAADGIAPKSTT